MNNSYSSLNLQSDINNFPLSFFCYFFLDRERKNSFKIFIIFIIVYISILNSYRYCLQLYIYIYVAPIFVAWSVHLVAHNSAKTIQLNGLKLNIFVCRILLSQVKFNENRIKAKGY